MRAMARVLLVVAVSVATLWPVAAMAQDEGGDDSVEVNSELSVKSSGRRLLGWVDAPFAPTGDEESGECEGGRDIVVSVKTKRGYKKVGSDTTDEDGSWSVRTNGQDGVYRIRARATEFAFSTEYGRVIQVHCLPASVAGRRTDGGFKLLDRVLGIRFGRNSGRGAGRLARTGLPAEIYTALGLSLIAAGLVLNRQAMKVS